MRAELCRYQVWLVGICFGGFGTLDEAHQFIIQRFKHCFKTNGFATSIKEYKVVDNWAEHDLNV